MAKQRVLVIDDDKITSRLVTYAFQKAGYEVYRAINGAEGLAKTNEVKPDLVILDVMMPDMSGLEVCQQLRADSSTAWLPIIMMSIKGEFDDRINGFRAGADEYVPKPASPKELLARAEALLQRPSRPQTSRARVIAVVGAKGGVGVTTVAVNIATVLVSQGKSVVLAELRSHRGTVAYNLKIKSGQDLGDLLAMEPAQISHSEVSQRLVQHPSGLRVLIAPQQPTDHLLTAAHMAAIVGTLSSEVECLILDLPAVMGQAVRQALDRADQILLVTELEALSVTCTHAELKTLKAWDMFDRVNLVTVSRSRSNTLSASAKVEKQFGVRVISVLSPAPEICHTADSMGVPLVVSNPEALVASTLVKLAEEVARPIPVNGP